MSSVDVFIQTAWRFESDALPVENDVREKATRAYRSSAFLYTEARAYARGGVGVKPPLELDILQKLYHLRKEIKCFRILFAC